MSSALLIVDVQNDFCPGGALPVPEGDRVIPVLNRYIELFRSQRAPIFASRDWHPSQTSHFKQKGGDWPPHCVAKTAGAQFHPELALPEETIVLSKGTDPGSDGYTAFQGHDSRGRTFEEVLRSRGINILYIGGLATDYCVKFTGLDALKKGFRVILLEDATRGIDEDAVKETIRLIQEKNGQLASFEEVSRKAGGRS
ncbi:MAG: isochorismatase family protein [Candidatus Omnitrophica bacterium]|nr:isochorismatase family protein [Candidatus Omnitrophota bacterium]